MSTLRCDATADNGCGNCVCSRERVGPLEVATWLDQDRAVAELTGELDVYTARELGAALTEIQKRARRPLLVLVLTNLAFADSSGLGVMIAAVKRAKQAGGAVALVEVPEFFAKVLRITGLTGVLPAFDTIEAAWEHLTAWQVEAL